jgi:hypothetical protein
MKALLERGKALLASARQSGAWAHEKELDRLELAWALQYDAQPADRELVRALLAQEVKRLAVAPGQGVGETLEILALLLARGRDPRDVWLFGAAKLANFDTSCGFDREHLFAGGVAATITLVKGSTHALREQLLELMLDEAGEPLFSEAGIAAWFEQRARWFPGDPALEKPQTWLDRALVVADRELALHCLQEWSAARQRDAKFLSLLAYYLKELAEHATEADVRSELVATIEKPFELASALRNWAEAERRARRPERALPALERAALLHRAAPDWRETGLARSFVQECFEAALTDERELATPAFALGEEFAATTPRLSLVALETAERAAQFLGDEARTRHYEALRRAEQQRIGDARA